jgi:hypothetical protein
MEAGDVQRVSSWSASIPTNRSTAKDLPGFGGD